MTCSHTNLASRFRRNVYCTTNLKRAQELQRLRYVEHLLNVG